MAMAPSSS
uniref:Uncharacterized protein n=2 Tax=Muroidea TaxID=337687 RepID=A0A8C6QUH9_NANGA